MKTVNRDAVVAVLLLLFCGVAFWETYHIKVFPSAAMDANVWPRLIIGVLAALCAIYLIQSLRRAERVEVVGVRALIGSYTNALWCFALFALFLLTLEWLGILIGGFLFVFLSLTALGNHSPRDHLTHAATALITIALTWVVFSYGLGVFLPQGTLMPIY